MEHILSRLEAETFVKSIDLMDIVLDNPHWGRGFSRLVDLWESKRRDNGYPPGIEEIDLLMVPDLLPGIQSYREVEGEGRKDAVTVFQGSEVVSFTSDETGKLQFADEILPLEMHDEWLRYIDFVERWPYPHWVVATSMRRRLGEYHREESVVVPCSSDGRKIDELVAANYYHKVG